MSPLSDERRAAIHALVSAETPLRGSDAAGGDPNGGRGVHSLAGTVDWLRRLSRAAARALPATGVAITLMTATGVQVLVAVANPFANALGELQIALGEGPDLDAFAERRPILVPDLADAPFGRWPGYLGAALEQGARAVFAFPLQLGAARLGVLSVYRDAPGMLSESSLARALTFSEVTVESLLDGQEHARPDRTEPTWGHVLDPHFAVYQAQGMVMIDLGVSLPDALARLRAYAYGQARPLADVARDIVAGRLRLEPEPP